MKRLKFKYTYKYLKRFDIQIWNKRNSLLPSSQVKKKLQHNVFNKNILLMSFQKLIQCNWKRIVRIL